jgi:hypothetical protein
MVTIITAEYYPSCIWPEEYNPEAIPCLGSFGVGDQCKKCVFEKGRFALDKVAPFFSWWMEQERLD